MLDGIHTQTTAFLNNQSHRFSDENAVVAPNSEHEEKVFNARRVRTVPGQDETRPDSRKRDSLELSQEAQDILKLQLRDSEVRAHEAAHAAAGGAFAGAPSYKFERGPDGQTYAVGGEVSIDVSPVAGDPEATLRKAQQIRAAALAPAVPSAQDMKVAQRAQKMATDARMALSEELSEELKSHVRQASDSKIAGIEGEEVSATAEPGHNVPHTSAGGVSSRIARLSVQA
jgi:hypothetical protein